MLSVFVHACSMQYTHCWSLSCPLSLALCSLYSALSEIQAPSLGQGATSLLSMVEAKGPHVSKSHAAMWVPLMDEKVVFHISYVCEYLCFCTLSTLLHYCMCTISCTSQHCSVLWAPPSCTPSCNYISASCTLFARRICHYVLSMTSQSHNSQLASLSIYMSVHLWPWHTHIHNRLLGSFRVYSEHLGNVWVMA